MNGACALDRSKLHVICHGHEIKLRPIEFQILAHLLENPGRLITRSELARAVWGRSVARGRTIDVNMGRLRKSMDSSGVECAPIRTLRGQGYCFEATLDDVMNSQVVGDSEICPRTAKYHAFGMEVDRKQKRVRRLGRDLRFQQKTFEVLDLLMSNFGKVYTREQIAGVVWAGDQIDLRRVDTVVSRLRKQLSGGVLIDPIRTMRGYGYKFDQFFQEHHEDWPTIRRTKVRLVR